MNCRTLLIITWMSGLLLGCGGGSSNAPQDDGEQSQGQEQNQSGEGEGEGESEGESEGQGENENEGGVQLDGSSELASYRVTVRNFWGADNFPQDFPESAHLSLWGGGTHNSAVSFWNPGDPPSRGLEDVAEAGLIDILLFEEVAAAIENGTAESLIEVRRFTDPQVAGVPGLLEFEVTVSRSYPLVSMVSMLGPSPDWFVGVSGLSLLADDVWSSALTVELPLYDGGSKSDITPIMGGADIIPPVPVALVAYDAATGTYLAAQTPQIVAELVFERLR